MISVTAHTLTKSTRVSGIAPGITSVGSFRHGARRNERPVMQTILNVMLCLQCERAVSETAPPHPARSQTIYAEQL